MYGGTAKKVLSMNPGLALFNWMDELEALKTVEILPHIIIPSDQVARFIYLFFYRPSGSAKLI